MPDPQDFASRVQRLEESQGFAERAMEQLSAEIARLGRQLAELQARVKRLEAGLDRPRSTPGADQDPEG